MCEKNVPIFPFQFKEDKKDVLALFLMGDASGKIPADTKDRKVCAEVFLVLVALEFLVLCFDKVWFDLLCV